MTVNAEGRDLDLVASDGNRFAAYAAKSAGDSDIGVVVMPDVRGLFPEYEEIVVRLAREGMSAVAMDWFGRSAGVGKRTEGFDFMTHTLETNAEDVQRDVAASIGYLRSAEGGSCRSVFTLGFSFGGRHSMLATAEGYGLAGAVGFYFMPSDRDRPPFMESSGRLGPTQRVTELASPILGIWAGEDTELGILPEDVAAFDSALDDAGVSHEVITYEGVPHSFFDRGYEDYAEVRAAAWDRVLTFIQRHAVSPAAA
jgi:carboxymethylenebutenolidase